MKTRKLLSVLLMTTMVVACGGGSSSTDKGGGGGTSANLNPFSDRNIPKQKESLRMIQFDTGIAGRQTITLDPVNGTYSAVNDKGDFIGNFEEKGDYDADNQTITPRSCEGDDKRACFPIGKAVPIDGYFAGIEDDGLVWFNEDAKKLAIFGYNPADEANLPSGKVTYTGKFAADVSDGEEYRVTGDAKTVVDFNTDTLSAEFSNFSDDAILSAGIDKASVNGSTFSGGQFSATTADRTIEGGNTYSYGEFYGEEGQELGGYLGYYHYEVDEEYPSIYIDGVWTGKK